MHRHTDRGQQVTQHEKLLGVAAHVTRGLGESAVLVGRRVVFPGIRLLGVRGYRLHAGADGGADVLQAFEHFGSRCRDDVSERARHL